MIRLLTEVVGLPLSGRILPPENLYGGLFTIILLYLYPVETIYAGWLTRRRLGILFAPWLLVGALWFVLPITFRELSSLNDVWTYWGEFNVWSRLVVLFLGIFPYCLTLFLIPYNWTRSRVGNRWIIHYALMIQLIGALYTLFMLTGSVVISSIHLLVFIAVVLVVTYQELFVRFDMLPSRKSDSGEVVPEIVKVIPLAMDNPLIGKLLKVMNEEEIWRNPDLTMTELVVRLGTNRSYLSNAIKASGYANFADMVNRRRIEALCEMTKKETLVNLQEAFFQVGFRSRETASRCFKKYTGQSPTDYIRGHAPST